MYYKYVGSFSVKRYNAYYISLLYYSLRLTRNVASFLYCIGNSVLYWLLSVSSCSNGFLKIASENHHSRSGSSKTLFATYLASLETFSRLTM